MIHRIAVDGGILEIADEGPKAAPEPPIVLLHGFTGSKESWGDLRALLGRSRRVVSADLPGHGGTEMGSELRRYSMEAAARALVDALARLDIDRFGLAGYSMGGRLALFVALEYPARVDRLLLESASAGIADPEERARRRTSDEELARFVERSGIEAFVDRWERLPLFETHRSLAREVREELRRSRLSCRPSGLAASLREMGTGSQPWLGARLGELTIPVVIAAGALDEKFMRIGREMAVAIRNARLCVIEGAGHAPHLERPAEFNRIAETFFAARQ